MKILLIEPLPSQGTHLREQLLHFGPVYVHRGISQQALLRAKREKFDVVILDPLSEGASKKSLGLIRPMAQEGITPIVFSPVEAPSVIKKCFLAGAQYVVSQSFPRDEVQKHFRLIFQKRAMAQGHGPFDQFSKNACIQKRFQHFLTNPYILESPILLTGPTGIGKTHLAKEIHRHLRPKGPFVHLNLTEIPESMVESELFGYSKGAFTGAISSKEGLFQQAHGGILFLDEIGGLSHALQTKLLRVIEEKRFVPFGPCKKNQEVRSQFALISATCAPIKQLIEKKAFRLDFYHRLSHQVFHIPPLFQRPEDIEMALLNLMKSSCQKICFTEEALKNIQSRSLDGNLRELKQIIHFMITQETNIVEALHIDQFYQQKGHGGDTQGIVTSAVMSLVEQEGLPFLINKIEKDITSLWMEKYEKKVNDVCRRLQISKGRMYRILNGHQESSPLLMR